MTSTRHHKEPYLVSCMTRSQRVLHVGCTNSPNTMARLDQGNLLHAALLAQASKLNATVVGIDIDGPALALLREHLPAADLREIDAHHLAEQLGPDERFDLIIAGDVIEHLPNPGCFLVACAQVLAPDGRLLITTANAFGLVRFLKMLMNHEAVHPEHTAYFSAKTLARLLAMSGLNMVDCRYYRCETIRGRTNLVRRLGNAIEWFWGALFPQCSEGVIAEAKIETRRHPDDG